MDNLIRYSPVSPNVVLTVQSNRRNDTPGEGMEIIADINSGAAENKNLPLSLVHIHVMISRSPFVFQQSENYFYTRHKMQ
jgi:hypothetical protein